tara:strand:- start:169 stop:363 length:195 start_codon:yes stop_codon:yes gene_type:complete
MKEALKIGDLVIPSSFSKYKQIYPPKMIIDIIVSERSGKSTELYVLEGEDQARRAETLFLVSRA